MIKLLNTLLTSFVILTGCSSKPASVIDETKYADLKGNCYQLAKESMLFTLPQCTNRKGLCFGIQALGTSWSGTPKKFRAVPDSVNEIESDIRSWNKQLNEELRWGVLSKKAKIIGTLRENHKLYLVDIILEDFGPLGYKLIVQMSLDDMKGKKVELPAYDRLIKPDWVSDKDRNLIFNSDYIKECDN